MVKLLRQTGRYFGGILGVKMLKIHLNSVLVSFE